uniref:peptidylprolyl isomerase n=1 Tax=Lotus japonicus TaxID=34305 RepID=I3SZ21_LOTJA|nr:unknown [Lotus japonicus]
MTSPGNCTCTCNSITLLGEKLSFGYGGGGGGGGVLSNLNLNPKAKSRGVVTVAALSPSQSRRSTAVLISLLPLTVDWLTTPPPAAARERRNKKNIPIDEYLTSPDGLKYYDLVEGKGSVAEKGSTVQVHFDCLYRGVTAVSSRESKILAGNRTIAQSYEFKVGAPPGRERKRDFVDNPNGLFSAQASPKPPAAMYTIVEGMRVGGKRTVLVPPENGYGKRGMNEIPPGATFEMNIELLQVKTT